MTLKHYSDNALLTNAVLLKSEEGFSAKAELGQPETLGVQVEDPLGAYDFKAYKTWYMIEDAWDATDHVWHGYHFDQEWSRGSDPKHVHAAGRQWQVDLFEVNGLLSRTIFRPDHPTANRPAENSTARVAWLLTVPAFAGVMIDHGLVQPTAIAMDANDYRKRTALDVLTDICLSSGDNFLLRYNDTHGDIELIIHDFQTSGLDTSDLRISNVAADVDNITVFAPVAPDTKGRRGASRIASGVLVEYTGGTHYAQRASTIDEFAPVDQVAPTQHVKTEAAAIALTERYLDQHSEHDERITTRIQLPAASLGIVKQGQLISAKYSHGPGWSNYRGARVMRKAFSRPEGLTQALYDVDLELVPTCPPIGVTQVARLNNGLNAAFLYFPFTPTLGSLLIAHIGYRTATYNAQPESEGWYLIAKQENIPGGPGARSQAIFAKTHNGSDAYINVGATTNRHGFLWEIAGGPEAAGLFATGIGTTGTGLVEAAPGLTLTSHGLALGFFALLNDNRPLGQHCWAADNGGTLEYGEQWPSDDGPYIAGWSKVLYGPGSATPQATVSECPAIAWTTGPAAWGAMSVDLEGGPC